MAYRRAGIFFRKSNIHTFPRTAVYELALEIQTAIFSLSPCLARRFRFFRSARPSARPTRAIPETESRDWLYGRLFIFVFLCRQVPLRERETRGKRRCAFSPVYGQPKSETANKRRKERRRSEWEKAGNRVSGYTSAGPRTTSPSASSVSVSWSPSTWPVARTVARSPLLSLCPSPLKILTLLDRSESD